jgi:hypothetical protein
MNIGRYTAENTRGRGSQITFRPVLRDRMCSELPPAMNRSTDINIKTCSFYFSCK